MNNHRGKGRVYRGTTGPTARQRRAATALREGQVRCEECLGGVRLRADGTLMNHRLDGYPCLAGGTTRYTIEELQSA